VADSRGDAEWMRCQGRVCARASTTGSRGTVPNPQTEPAANRVFHSVYGG